MEIKYEPVFGDHMFASGTCEIAIKSPLGEIIEMKLTVPIVIPEGWAMIAMRRIIRTPTWTVADKKAGKLPEVGAFYDAEGCKVKHLGVGAAGYEDIFHFEYPSGACGCSNKLFIKPIESPEEKAARLRVEWCKKAIGCAPISSEMQHYEMKRLGEYIGNIYDALLTGDLPVPGKEVI